MSYRIAILASGEGTTADAFIRACARRQVDGEVVLIICNKESAGIFDRVKRLNDELGLQIETALINAQTHPTVATERLLPGGQTAAEEAAIAEMLHAKQIDLVLLMGYLRRIGPRLVDEFGWRKEYISPYQARMLNTHPGLLPETQGFWGVHVQEHVIEKQLPFSGQTLHIVAENYDDGPMLAEHPVPVEPGDTAESLFERVKLTEKASLPSDIQAFIVARENYLRLNRQGG